MFEGFFFAFSAFKENVIEGDGPKNQTELTNPPTVVLTQW
jgi:hypothetical protein